MPNDICVITFRDAATGRVLYVDSSHPGLNNVCEVCEGVVARLGALAAIASVVHWTYRATQPVVQDRFALEFKPNARSTLWPKSN